MQSIVTLYELGQKASTDPKFISDFKADLEHVKDHKERSLDYPDEVSPHYYRTLKNVEIILKNMQESSNLHIDKNDLIKLNKLMTDIMIISENVCITKEYTSNMEDLLENNDELRTLAIEMKLYDIDQILEEFDQKTLKNAVETMRKNLEMIDNE